MDGEKRGRRGGGEGEEQGTDRESETLDLYFILLPVHGLCCVEAPYVLERMT